VSGGDLLDKSDGYAHDFNPSLMLWLLALMGGLLMGKVPVTALADCFTLARAYTIPLMKPTTMADTLGKVTGASKKMRPDTAIGSLLRAPTMEYVVDDVTRTHHAEVYEMKTDERPEMNMAKKMPFRVAGGKLRLRFSDDQSSTRIEKITKMGMESRLL
jgi:hypothetical protein